MKTSALPRLSGSGAGFDPGRLGTWLVAKSFVLEPVGEILLGVEEVIWLVVGTP